MYSVIDEKYRHDVRSYLTALKNAVVTNTWNISIFSYIPKENIDIVKECLLVDAGVINATRLSIARKFSKKTDDIDGIMKDFHLTLRNDIYKRLWNKVNYGTNFGNVFAFNNETGICELGLSHNAYMWLKDLRFNTIEDLTSICTHKLLSFKGIGSVWFTDILTRVHNKGFKFVDEKEIDIEILKKMNYLLLAKQFNREQTIFERRQSRQHHK